MDIVKSKPLDSWTELGAGSVPCRECRTLLAALRDAGHTLTLHEDAAGVVHLEIQPKVRPALEKALSLHKDHVIGTLVMLSIPQSFRVERAQWTMDGTCHWMTVEERETTYTKAAGEWDALLRQIGSWSDGRTAYRAVWVAAGETRRTANFPPFPKERKA